MTPRTRRGGPHRAALPVAASQRDQQDPSPFDEPVTTWSIWHFEQLQRETKAIELGRCRRCWHPTIRDDGYCYGCMPSYEGVA
jgi:hypothetical protein